MEIFTEYVPGISPSMRNVPSGRVNAPATSAGLTLVQTATEAEAIGVLPSLSTTVPRISPIAAAGGAPALPPVACAVRVVVVPASKHANAAIRVGFIVLLLVRRASSE